MLWGPFYKVPNHVDEGSTLRTSSLANGSTFNNITLGVSISTYKLGGGKYLVPYTFHPWKIDCSFRTASVCCVVANLG